MARHMAERLRQLERRVEDAPGPESTSSTLSIQDGPPTPYDPSVPPIEGHQLVMITGGSGDAALVRDISRVLSACKSLGYVVSLMAQHRDTEYKPSELRRDLRENLELATAVLMVVHRGPQDQVHEQLREYTKAAARHPERAPYLDVCLLGDQPLNFRPPGARVHSVTDGNHRCSGFF